MNRVGLILLIAMAVIGGWFLFQGGQLNQWTNALQGEQTAEGYPLDSVGGSLPSVTQRFYIPDFFPRDHRFVRIATFNVELRDRAKGENQDILRNLATIIAQFDIMAMQDVAPEQQHLVGAIVDMLNATGRHYDYVMGPRVGRDQVEQFAYVFDQRRVEVDRRELYTVEDPDDLLNNEPFVAWFRCKGPQAENAFTFSLVNIHTDTMERDRENGILGSVFREVRNDQRGEDDVILLGDFQAAAQQLRSSTRVPDPQLAVTDLATDTRADHQLSNILCSRQATDESTGRSGVLDFLREMNLSLDQALQISGHLPVWAEFDMREGGRSNLAEIKNSEVAR